MWTAVWLSAHMSTHFIICIIVLYSSNCWKGSNTPLRIHHSIKEFAYMNNFVSTSPLQDYLPILVLILYQITVDILWFFFDSKLDVWSQPPIPLPLSLPLPFPFPPLHWIMNLLTTVDDLCWSSIYFLVVLWMYHQCQMWHPVTISVCMCTC